MWMGAGKPLGGSLGKIPGKNWNQMKIIYNSDMENKTISNPCESVHPTSENLYNFI